MDNHDKKRTLIIEAATKRFAHFGIAKTTMTEIAKDLSLSKALLYYYFPDKISLYAAVFESIATKMFDKIEQGLIDINNCEEAVFYLIDMRLAFAMKYYNLFDQSLNTVTELADELSRVIQLVSELEIKTIASIFNKANKSGELVVDKPDYIAEIFLNAMIGMRFCVLKDKKAMFIPTKEEFDEISKMQKKLAVIFINGLRNQLSN
ncbi:TetR/AcrR family transcriptional regulator [Olivibacter domesticus]|uniref:Transcriptional regulator, TetR family n=1 Tax=Olivibacter domesticus TaxID=407022 RepID=A0A1H7VCW1_OLID1|nr:TetR/AcrR family transcriptional regulator [Olivibacter domesticus]SEM06709.1 transcriptional regulator, TetR family [Olivibacter domesticus]